MKHRIAVGGTLAFMLLAGSVIAAEALKSGPQVGDKITVPFAPLNINGPTAGEKVCQV